MIISEGQRFTDDSFACILLHLHPKDILRREATWSIRRRIPFIRTYLIEEELNLFVRQIDAQLFEAVQFKVFKTCAQIRTNEIVHRSTTRDEHTIDVEQTDLRDLMVSLNGIGIVQRLVDLADQPGEEPSVQMFRKSITRI